MSRPWIEFVFSQHLPWQEGIAGGARDDVQCKVLSIDSEAGDSSLLVRYPAGWTRKLPEALTAEEEMYILDGEIEINGRTFRRDSYACLPAGYERQQATSERGCVALTFFDRPPELSASFGGYQANQLVEYLNTYDMKWDATAPDPSLAWMGLNPHLAIRPHDRGQNLAVPTTGREQVEYRRRDLSISP